MTRRSRRTILSGTAGLFALSAGCLDEAGVSDGDGNGGDDANGGADPGAGGNGDTDDTSDENEDGDASTDGDDGTASFDSVPFTYPAGPTEPGATPLLGADEATDWLAERDRDSDRLVAFVEETDFGEAVIVAVEADAPNPCYELALEDYALEDEATDAALDLETAVSDDSAEADSGEEMGCAQVEVVVARLVRAPIASDPTASVTLVDRHGEVHGLTAAVDSDGESAEVDA